MERIYTLKKTILTRADKMPVLLAEEDLNENEFINTVDFLRKFTGLWVETSYNKLPCFTLEDEDGIEKIFFE